MTGKIDSPPFRPSERSESELDSRLFKDKPTPDRITEWDAAPHVVLPTEGQCHIWKIPLDGLLPGGTDYRRILSTDELARAERHAIDKVRTRFVSARMALRTILARYLKTTPAAIQFSYGALGKPKLQHPVADLRFNLSHCDELALLALVGGVDVGIDLEKLKTRSYMADIAGRVFSPTQISLLEGLRGDAYTRAFYAFWTEIEATLKASGGGIFQRDRSAQPIPDNRTYLVPELGYLAALAFEPPIRRKLRFRYYAFDHRHFRR